MRRGEKCRVLKVRGGKPSLFSFSAPIYARGYRLGRGGEGGRGDIVHAVRGEGRAGTAGTKSLGGKRVVGILYLWGRKL